jgi:hypothetical protein
MEHSFATYHSIITYKHETNLKLYALTFKVGKYTMIAFKNMFLSIKHVCLNKLILFQFHHSFKNPNAQTQTNSQHDFHHRSDIRNTSISQRCSKRSIFKYFKKAQKYVKYAYVWIELRVCHYYDFHPPPKSLTIISNTLQINF